MKKLITFLLALALLLSVGAVPASAGDSSPAGRYWSTFNTGDATGPAATYLAFGMAPRMSGMAPALRIRSATGDAAGSLLTMYDENGDSTTMDAAYSSGGKVLPVVDTDAFDCTAGVGSWVAIYDAASPTSKFEFNRVSSCTSDASLNLVRNTVYTYASGSKVYEMTSVGSVVIGNATVEKDPTWMVGKPGSGRGFSVNGTSAASINFMGGDYVPQ